MSHDFSKWRQRAALQRSPEHRCKEPAPQTPVEPPQTPQATPQIEPGYSYSNDLLGCVYRLVQVHAWGPELPKLTDNQILRTWNDAALAPPEAEFCLLTHLSSVRHGTNAYEFEVPEGDTDMGLQHIYKCVEHSVQVDFFSSYQDGEQRARRRASILEMLFNSHNADSIIKGMNESFSAVFADDPMAFNEIDETHGNRQRHSVTLHISETVRHAINQRYFDAVNLSTLPVDGLPLNEVNPNGGTTK